MTRYRDDFDEVEDEDDEDEDNPNDPSHRDYDLSEAAAGQRYDDWPIERPWFVRRWVHLLIAVVVTAGLILPFLR